MTSRHYDNGASSGGFSTSVSRHAPNNVAICVDLLWACEVWMRTEYGAFILSYKPVVNVALHCWRLLDVVVSVLAHTHLLGMRSAMLWYPCGDTSFGEKVGSPSAVRARRH